MEANKHYAEINEHIDEFKREKYTKIATMGETINFFKFSAFLTELCDIFSGKKQVINLPIRF